MRGGTPPAPGGPPARRRAPRRQSADPCIPRHASLGQKRTSACRVVERAKHQRGSSTARVLESVMNGGSSSTSSSVRAQHVRVMLARRRQDGAGAGRLWTVSGATPSPPPSAAPGHHAAGPPPSRTTPHLCKSCAKTTNAETTAGEESACLLGESGRNAVLALASERYSNTRDPSPEHNSRCWGPLALPAWYSSSGRRESRDLDRAPQLLLPGTQRAAACRLSLANPRSSALPPHTEAKRTRWSRAPGSSPGWPAPKPTPFVPQNRSDPATNHVASGQRRGALQAPAPFLNHD